MFQPTRSARRLASFAPAALASFALGGCFAGGASDVAPSAPAPAPVAPAAAAFAPHYGFVTSEGVASRARVATKGTLDTYSVLGVEYNTSPSLRTFNATTTANPAWSGPANQQKIEVTTPGLGTTQNVTGLIEGSGGTLFRGGGSNQSHEYVYYTSAPSRALENSLGVTTLAYSYIGMGAIGEPTFKTSGYMYDTSIFSLFGGQKTTDMPTSGAASYQGAFEGVEQGTIAGATNVSNARISGAANMNADFKAGTVSGRIDDVNRYTYSTGAYSPVKSTADYSLGFSGAITGNAFGGGATLNQKNSSTLMTNTTQTGAMQGGFFGPKAAEAAGAVAVTSNHDGNWTLMSGSFGAKKQ